MNSNTLRILQEVAAGARTWANVQTILHAHRDVYFAMPTRDREKLNARIKDLMRERQS